MIFRRRGVAYAYLTPLIVFISLMLIYPIVSSLLLSFQDIRIPSGAIPLKLSTVKNYTRLFTSPEFFISLWQTLYIVALATLFSTAFGLFCAVWLEPYPLLRLLAVLPWAIPSVTTAVIWSWIFDGAYGLLNWALLKMSLLSSPIVWNQDYFGAVLMVLLVFTWKGFPFVTITLLAALKSIPGQLYEAAGIEGATGWQKFRYITFPLLLPITSVSALLTGLWVFQDYPIIALLTGGGPSGKKK